MDVVYHGWGPDGPKRQLDSFKRPAQRGAFAFAVSRAESLIVRFDEWRAPLGWVSLVLAATVLIIAFALPFVAFSDRDEGLTGRTIAGMKTEASQGSKIPPLRFQISRVAEPPPRPDILPDGAVRWLTIFGISYGETTFVEGQSSTAWNWAALKLTLATLALVEFALIGLGGWLVWTAP